MLGVFEAAGSVSTDPPPKEWGTEVERWDQLFNAAGDKASGALAVASAVAKLGMDATASLPLRGQMFRAGAAAKERLAIVKDRLAASTLRISTTRDFSASDSFPAGHTADLLDDEDHLEPQEDIFNSMQPAEHSSFGKSLECPRHLPEGATRSASQPLPAYLRGGA